MSYLAFAVLLLSSGTAQGQPTAQDCAILGTLWRKWGRQSLFPTNCCNTTGVVCSSTRVTELNWWAFIAPDTALKGPLHPELFTLTGLTAIRIGGNQLNGSIPTMIGQLINLQEIQLHSNQLSGPIPSQIGSLTNLQSISMGANDLSGSIPTEITQLRNLQTLSLNNNRLNGTIPTLLGSLTNLTSIGLGNNQLSGVVPSSFENLVNLRSLSLQNNQFSGSIPAGLGNLVLLSTASFSGNPLLESKKCSVLPAIDPQPDCANVVSLYDNLGGSEKIPVDASTNCCGWNNIECSGFNKEMCWEGDKLGRVVQTLRVTRINWEHQNLRGTISPSIGNLTELRSLRLRDNHITGVIPNNIEQLGKLDQLDLENNRLSGRLPAVIGNLRNLTRLSVANNLLSGSIPVTLGNLTALFALELGNNQIAGAIPRTLLNLTSLKTLELNDNLLTGEIPTNLGNLRSLLTLSLSGNLLSGAIPTNLGSLRNLTFLSLAQNQFSGAIPPHLGNLTRLEFLYLQENYLNTTIPSEIGQLVRLRHLFVSKNFLGGMVPSQIGNLRHLLALRVEANNLTGVSSSLSQLNDTKRVLLPNPMTSVPYDLVSQNPSFTLSESDWLSYLNINPLTKRQSLSSQATLTAEELFKTCPLSDVTNPDVPAGCIAGVYKKYCDGITTDAQFAQCQATYDQVFAASIFKPLGEVCPAWKSGPRSYDCLLAVSKFKYELSYMTVTKEHAANLTTTILGSQKYAPCRNVGKITCKW